jgi:PPOX class probable F420-dependent enzyme
VTPGGYPHTSVVWCDFDGECIRINTMRGFVKDRNMRRDPRVTLLCFDPHEPLRYLEVRGRVIEMTESGAREHLDRLASQYSGRPVHIFGDSIPARFAETETPVIVRVRPAHIVAVDGVAMVNTTLRRQKGRNMTCEGKIPGRRAAAMTTAPAAPVPRWRRGQSVMRSATAGWMREACRAGQVVTRTEAASAAPTTREMVSHGTENPMPVPLNDRSLLNSR